MFSSFIFTYRNCICVYLECLTDIFCKPRWQQLTIDIEEIQHPSLQRLLCFPLAMFHLNSKIYIFFKSCTRKVIGKYRHAWCLSNNLAKILTVKVIFLFVKKCTFKNHYNAYCLEYEYIYIPNLHWFSALMVPTQWQEPFEHTAPVYPPHSPRVKQRSPSSASANLNNKRLTCF